MAKKQTPVKNRPPVKPVKAPVTKKAAVSVAKTPGQGLPVLAIIFFVMLALCFFFFLKNFFTLPELSNAHIKFRAGWIRNMQLLIYVLLTLAFAIAGWFAAKRNKTWKYFPWMTLGVFVLLTALHMIAFNPAFEDVDDNAGYMIAAKSLVEMGGSYYLYLPEIKPDTEIALGLPVMLSPLYMIFGMDTLKMEYLIMIMLVASIVVCYLLFAKLTGNKALGLVFAILYGIHPYIVSFSSIIMTEIPYLFWSMLALYLVLRYAGHEKFSWLFLILSLVAIFMTYLTRAVGAGFIFALFFFLLFKSGLGEYLKKRDWRFYRDLRFKKFFFLTAALFVVLLIWQIVLSSWGGPSQSSQFLERGTGLFSKNADAIWQVLSQNIFAGDMVRKGLEPVSFLWFFIFALVIAGFLSDLRRNGLLAWYTLFVILIHMVGSSAVEVPVVSRYMIIFTPVFIWFFYTAVKSLADLIFRKAKPGVLAGLIALTFMLPSSLTGTSFYIQRNNTGQMYDIAYANFIECAKWAKQNLPAEAIVASRKERIFYIYSDLRGYKHTGYRDRYSDEFEKMKLEEMVKNNTSYLILDTFNRSTINNILPIVQKHPDKFKLIKTIGDQKNGPCYVFEVVKWWTPSSNSAAS